MDFSQLDSVLYAHIHQRLDAKIQKEQIVRRDYLQDALVNQQDFAVWKVDTDAFAIRWQQFPDNEEQARFIAFLRAVEHSWVMTFNVSEWVLADEAQDGHHRALHGTLDLMLTSPQARRPLSEDEQKIFATLSGLFINAVERTVISSVQQANRACIEARNEYDMEYGEIVWRVYSDVWRHVQRKLHQQFQTLTYRSATDFLHSEESYYANVLRGLSSAPCMWYKDALRRLVQDLPNVCVLCLCVVKNDNERASLSCSRQSTPRLLYRDPSMSRLVDLPSALQVDDSKEKSAEPILHNFHSGCFQQLCNINNQGNTEDMCPEHCRPRTVVPVVIVSQ
jgi:hypothetical protein